MNEGSLAQRKDTVARMRTDGQRYEEKVDRTTTPNGCHPWTASTSKDGYGRFRWNGHIRYASNFGWELLHGPIPAGMKVCHTCDNPPCQNPKHWFLGTDSDNQRDSVEKGRHSALRKGDEANRLKLTDAEVAEIRAVYIPRGKPGHVYGSRKALAKQYGVAPEYISMLMHPGERGYRT